MHARRTIFALAAAALTLTACGGGSADPAPNDDGPAATSDAVDSPEAEETTAPEETVEQITAIDAYYQGVYEADGVPSDSETKAHVVCAGAGTCTTLSAPPDESVWDDEAKFTSDPVPITYVDGVLTLVFTSEARPFRACDDSLVQGRPSYEATWSVTEDLLTIDVVYGPDDPQRAACPKNEDLPYGGLYVAVNHFEGERLAD